MNADEARKLTEAYIANQYVNTELDKRIEDAAKKGKSGIYFDLLNIEDTSRNKVFDAIKHAYFQKGFTIKRNTYGGDMRGEPPSDGVFISW